MHFANVLSVLALSSLAAAQIYGPAPGPASPTSSAASSASSSAPPPDPSAPANTAGFVNVDVGFQATFTFHPNNFTAPNGTVVTFFFPNPGFGHSVTQSSFANPCTYLAANSSAGTPGGFDSGLQQDVQFSITITDDTKPIWFFCKQVDHCGMGMVGSINAPTNGSNTFAAYQAAAVQIGANEQTTPDNGFVNGGVGANATAAPTNTASAAATSNTGGGSASSATRIVAGASAGIIAAAVSFFVFA